MRVDMACHMPHLWGVQVRIHPDLADIVRRNVKAHKRVFKRNKSAAAFVNERLRDVFKCLPVSNPIT